MDTKSCKLLVLAIAAIGFSNMGLGTPLGIYDFTAQPGNQAATPRSGGSGEVYFSEITRGPGLIAATGPNSMSSAAWTGSPIPDTQDYYEVTVNVMPGYNVGLERVYFRYAESGPGPRQMVVRSNLDGYTANIGSATLVPGATADIVVDFIYPIGPCTLRFFAFSSVGGGTLSLQNHSMFGGMVFDGDIVQIPLLVQWSASSQIVPENCGTMYVSAYLSTYSMEDVVVPFTVTATASDPADYTVTSGSFIIPAGSIFGNVQITVVDDLLPENSETVVLTMGTPTNASLDATTVHTATIADNDGLVQWTASSQSGAESVGAAMTVTAQLSAACGLPVTVPFTLSGTASYLDDYTINSRITPIPITIPAGSLTGSATIWVYDDPLYEPNETVVLTMGTPTNAKLGAVSVHTATIIDNDLPSLVVSPATLTVNEGGAAAFTVKLSAAPFAITTVTTASAGGDTDLSVIFGGSLTFTTTNWSDPQLVIIKAAEDTDTLNGQAAFTVSSAGLSSQTVTVTESDNEKIFVDWAFSAELTGNNASPEATPYGDGVSNLLKYAFNMTGNGPDARVLIPGTGMNPGNSTAGLPALLLDRSGAQPVLRFEYLRRKNSGLVYTPLMSSDLTNWLPLTASAAVSDLGTGWERVIVAEPSDPAVKQMSFGRVMVELP